MVNSGVVVDAATEDNLGDPLRDRTTYMGRDYQTWSLRHQVNLAPVDDDEESRLRSQHALMKAIFKTRKNALLPDFVKSPRKVLDCGFGTGDWAYEVAEFLPECEVVAIDICPIMELGDMPDNLEQELCDMNDPLTFPAMSFSFVHSRFVAGGIAHSRWPSYLSDIKRVLQIGGWVQLTEWELVFRSDSGDADKLQNLRKWSEMYLTALSAGSGNARKSRTVPEGLETMLRASGFLNVSVDIQEVPTCGWPASPSKSAIGEEALNIMESLLGGPALYPVTNRTRQPKSEFDALVDQARLELRDRSAKPYLRLYTCFGQKA